MVHVRALREYRGMDAVVAGVFGVGGIVIGAVLNDVSAKRGRREAHAEQRADQRLARELAVAEKLDNALLNATRLVERTPPQELASAIKEAHESWVDAWVAFSPRIRQWPLVDRYVAVGNVLLTYEQIKRPLDSEDQDVMVRAIRNARWALAYFMRGDGVEPARMFPSESEVRRLIATGTKAGDPAGLLRNWVRDNEEPEFRPETLANGD